MDLRNKYLNAKRPVVGSVDVPEWGTVKIRAVTQAEMDEVAEMSKTDPTKASFLGIVLGVSDEDGNPVFTKADIDQMRGTVPISTIKAISEAMLVSLGVTVEKVNEAKKG